MAMSNPIISIVTPTFNRSHEIDYLIESINKQTLGYEYFEMIISDDGSTDDSHEKIKKWIKLLINCRKLFKLLLCHLFVKMKKNIKLLMSL